MPQITKLFSLRKSKQQLQRELTLALASDDTWKVQSCSRPKHINPLDKVPDLIEAGADVNGMATEIPYRLYLDTGPLLNNREGLPIIQLAIIKVRDLDTIKLLLAQKPDLTKEYYPYTGNEHDNFGPILHNALQTKASIEIISALLDAGADLNAQNKNGYTPIMVASDMVFSHYEPKDSNLPIIELFIERGARLGLNELQHLADYIVRIGCLKLIPLIQAKGHELAPSSGGNLLHMLCSLSIGDHSFEFANPLLQDPIKVNQLDNNGRSPLSLAAEKTSGYSFERLSAALIPAGADLNIQDKKGKTALHYAASLKQDNYANVTVKSLINRGAKLDLQDMEGRMPIHCSAAKNLDALKALVAAGQSIDQEDNHGVTPLMLAVQAGQTANVIYLVNAGADCSKQTKDGSSIISFALECKANQPVEFDKIREILNLSHIIKPKVASVLSLATV